MKKWFILFAGVAAMTSFPLSASNAQGIGIEVPGVGVQIGDPYRRHYRTYDYDRPRFRERDVYLGGNCRTVTVERDDGSVKRIRRCN